MGQSFSEPATLVDLGEAVRAIYLDRPSIACPFWAMDDAPLYELVQALQHVDDALLMSCVWCPKCLHAGVQRIWPSDVGTTLEECGPSLRFLSAQIVVTGSNRISVFPHFPNHQFARGTSLHPELARLAEFHGTQIHRPAHLRMYLLTRIISFNFIANGATCFGRSAAIDVTLECMRLSWPYSWIACVLRAMPRKHSSPFMSSVRRFGKLLAHDRHSLAQLSVRSRCLRVEFLFDRATHCAAPDVVE